MKKISLALVLGVFLFLPITSFGTQAHVDLSKKLTRTQAVDGQKLINPRTLKKWYQFINNEMLWATSKNRKKRLNSLVRIIEASQHEGLNPQYYHLNKLLSYSQKKRLNQNQRINLELLAGDAFLTLASHYRFGRFDYEYNRDNVLKKDEIDLFFNELVKIMNSRTIEKSMLNLLPSNKNYYSLREGLAKFRRFIQNKEWPKVGYIKKLTPGQTHPQIIPIKNRLIMDGYLKSVDLNSPKYDRKTAKAVKAFQRQHGLNDDGTIGSLTLDAFNVSKENRLKQIAINLDRLRAFPRHPGQKYIVVNVPNFQLDFYKNGKPVKSLKTIVGRRDRPTPLFSQNMKFVVLNPFWHVPESIAIKDKLPKIKEDPDYIKKMGMKVYVGEGEEKKIVDASSIDWTNVSTENFSYKLVQNPGRGNALGSVKFLFPNRHAVYIHDTPSRYLFKRERRTYSSGCIRVQDPHDLAKIVLEDDSEWNEKNFKKALRSGVKRTITLKNELPVHLVYHTAWVNQNGIIEFRDDVYNIDKRFMNHFL